ncbi:hypothetical protein BN938_0838 [Mucinivorans hirudinis]|uniref:Uncharacterized protein n=1 Tax=Mucinivorans hirudinis TaxID=1433126 RepID=A0A060RC33_9BACT|nr:hypothetical protein BN938_0838 [Mucinivorans hirudinis]
MSDIGISIAGLITPTRAYNEFNFTVVCAFMEIGKIAKININSKFFIIRL